jgi:hypothetical protein
MRDVRGSALLELTRVRLLEVVREPEALFWMFVFLEPPRPWPR